MCAGAARNFVGKAVVGVHEAMCRQRELWFKMARCKGGMWPWPAAGVCHSPCRCRGGDKWLQQRWVPLSADSQGGRCQQRCAEVSAGENGHALLGDPALAEARMPGSSLKGQKRSEMELHVVCVPVHTPLGKRTLLRTSSASRVRLPVLSLQRFVLPGASSRAAQPSLSPGAAALTLPIVSPVRGTASAAEGAPTGCHFKSKPGSEP